MFLEGEEEETTRDFPTRPSCLRNGGWFFFCCFLVDVDFVRIVLSVRCDLSLVSASLVLFCLAWAVSAVLASLSVFFILFDPSSGLLRLRVSFSDCLEAQ